ncbi:MAG: nucleotide exchange factor GrpE [Halioglobus sp.]|nr:nucleotide exchange factor GrpE [Halioglobus sp.]MDG2327630.1 nucleotide exchange factor GrpE [Halioglobus sp.]
MAEQDPKQPENEVQDDQTANPEAQLETAEEVAAAEAADAGAEGDTEASLDDELSQLQEDLLTARDAALRAQADAQNVKRRAEQDVEKARKFALERFASDLLPVVDNLERALEAASGDDEAIKPIAEGVELTLKSFIDVLGKNKVDVVDPQGEPFDPNLHQAITMIENKEVEPNTVTAVMQKGYSLNGRLIRPAMVMVSKGG